MICPDYPFPHFFVFTDQVPALLYYSHLPAMAVALFIGFFVILKNRSLASKVLFSVLASFFIWTFLNLITWTNNSSQTIMFVWSFFGIFYTLICILSLYFVYVFIDKKDVSFRIKIILGLLFLPVIIFAPTNYDIKTFGLTLCSSINALPYYENYYYGVGFLMFSWILFLLVVRYRKTTKEMKKQIVWLGVGIELFLLSFFATGYIAGLLIENSYGLEFYGLFGMTFFMGVLGYLIVKFKAFDIKLIGAQALVFVQFILIGSMLFFAKSLTNQILTVITLVITSGAGWFLVQSVKKEVERKEELQKISDALAIANQRLKELDATKSEFISIASHQLRTPLTAIKGYISLLLEGSYGVVPAPVLDILNKLYSVNNRLVHLVEDLLNVSRIEAGRIQYSFAPTQLEPIIVELVDMFKPTAKDKKLTLEMKLLKNPLPLLTIDPNKIKEVLSNLIDNSLKYTVQGGVTVSLESTPSVARIIVSDTGIGIKPEDKGKLFEKFIRTSETTKMVASGAGLGLYVGKSFIEAHGGKIWAESDGEGKGSRFIIELPLINPKIHIGTSDQPTSVEPVKNLNA